MRQGAASPGRWRRLHAWFACRRCAAGWIAYLAVAALVVAIFAEA